MEQDTDNIDVDKNTDANKNEVLAKEPSDSSGPSNEGQGDKSADDQGAQNQMVICESDSDMQGRGSMADASDIGCNTGF